MNIYQIIQSQYLASLDMLEKVIESCPEHVWRADSHKNRFWHIAYHALFYVHLYLQPTEADFRSWPKAHPKTNSLQPSDSPGEPYSQAELLEYVAFCRTQVREIVPMLDLHAASGFSWLPFSKLETQFYNIRHLMQHTGELMERLWTDAGVEVNWVGMHPVD